jgi:hypothetical protein
MIVLITNIDPNPIQGSRDLADSHSIYIQMQETLMNVIDIQNVSTPTVG